MQSFCVFLASKRETACLRKTRSHSISLARTEAVQKLKIFFHRHRYCCHPHRLLVVLAAEIPAAMSAALSASAGRKSRFAGLSATESAVLISAVSPLRLQPRGSAQSRSCFRHAQSSLSVQGSLNCPPRCLYVNASTFCPAVQFGPHQLP